MRAHTHTDRHTHAHMPWKFTLVYTRSTTENFRAFQAATLTRNLAKPASRVPERSHTLGSSRPKKSFVSSMAPTAANKERRSTDFMVETRTENPGTALRLQKLHSELRAGSPEQVHASGIPFRIEGPYACECLRTLMLVYRRVSGFGEIPSFYRGHRESCHTADSLVGARPFSKSYSSYLPTQSVIVLLQYVVILLILFYGDLP